MSVRVSVWQVVCCRTACLPCVDTNIAYFVLSRIKVNVKLSLCTRWTHIEQSVFIDTSTHCTSWAPQLFLDILKTRPSPLGFVPSFLAVQSAAYPPYRLHALAIILKEYYWLVLQNVWRYEIVLHNGPIQPPFSSSCLIPKGTTEPAR